jgi:hypothetical protein
MMVSWQSSNDRELLLRLLTIIFSFLLSTVLMPSVLASRPVKKTRSLGDNSESQAFLAKLRARILNNWLLQDGKNVVVLEATVHPTGEVLEVKTSKSNADPLAIEAATNAFEKSQPVGALPSRYHGDCTVTLTFTSTVDPHGDSNSDLTSRIDQISQNTKDGAAAQPSGGQAQGGEAESKESSIAK